MNDRVRASADSLDKQLRKPENTSLPAWKEVTLGSQLDAIIGGGTPSRTRPDYWTDGGIPWITVKDMLAHRITGTQEQITETGLNNSSANLVPPDTVIVATRMAVGRTTRSTVPAAINQDLKALFPKPTLMPEYLHLVMQRAQPTLESQASGSTVKGIRLQSLQDYRFDLPSIPEQRRIVEMIQIWETALQLTKDLISATRERKRGLMQVLLTGKKRFKEFESCPTWTEVSLGDVAEMTSGGTPRSSVPEYYGGGIPWASISDMTNSGRFLVDTQRTLTQLGVENSSAKLFPAGTLLFAMYASIGKCSIARIEVATSQAILGITPREQLNRDYLYYFLSSMESKFVRMGQHGTQRNLNAAMVRGIKIPLPSVTEQIRIATLLSVADEEIANLEQQLEAYKLQKRGLMQQLLTGKKRVNLDNLEPVTT